jgi:AcrR family transcriptional regulator
MEHLASLLGMSKKTVYQYFPSKEELIRDVVQNTCTSMDCKIDDILKNRDVDFVTRINNFIVFLMGIYARMSPALLLDLQRSVPDVWKQINSYRRERVRECFGGMIDEGIAKGVFRPNLAKEIVILMWLSAIESILNPDMLLQLPLSPNQALDAIARVMFQGIMTDEARTDFLKNQLS